MAITLSGVGRFPLRGWPPSIFWYGSDANSNLEKKTTSYDRMGLVELHSDECHTRTVGDGSTESTLENSIKNASQRKISVPVQSVSQLGSQVRKDRADWRGG